MKTVFIVRAIQAYEDNVLCEVFGIESDALAYCQEMNSQDEEDMYGYHYVYKEWSVK